MRGKDKLNGGKMTKEWEKYSAMTMDKLTDISYYIVPVISPALFPQFKRPKPHGVVHPKNQKGVLLFLYV